MTRHWVFRNYWWVALLGGAVGVVLSIAVGGSSSAELVCVSVSTAVGFAYFAQQQKLAEIALFHQLFTEFNARYNELNGPLASITRGAPTELTTAQRDLIIDYFNLCAEEYLFYKEGYIHREVWKSWCRGILYYLEHEAIRTVWEEEVGTASHYGLTEGAIRHGAI